MPQIAVNPLRTSKVGASGLLSGRSGQVSIGAGNINTPNVPKPAYLQFMQQDTSFGTRVGKELNQLTSIAQQYAEEEMKQEAQANGYEKAISLRRKHEARYNGDSKSPGLTSKSGRAYYEGVTGFIEVYDQDILDTVDELAPYEASIFLGQAKIYRDSLNREMRIKARKERNAYIMSSHRRLDAENMEDITGQAYTEVVLGAKLATQEELQEKTNFILQKLTAESVRRQQQTGVGAEMNDVVLTEFFVQMYSKGDNEADAADMLFPLLSEYIMDPKYKEAIHGAKVAQINRQYELLNTENKLVAAGRVNALNANYDSMISTLDSFTVEGEATQKALGYYSISPDMGNEAVAYVNARFNNKPATVESQEFMTEAMQNAWRPGYAAARAKNDGIALTSGQIKELRVNFKSRVSTEIGYYAAEFKTSVGALMSNDMPMAIGGADFVTAILLGIQKSKRGERVIASMQGDLRRQLSRAAAKGSIESLQATYNTAWRNVLDLTKMDSIALNISKKDTLVPPGTGLYSEMDLDRTASVQGLAQEMLRLIPPNYWSEVPGVPQDLYSKISDISRGQGNEITPAHVKTMVDTFMLMQRHKFKKSGADIVTRSRWNAELPLQEYTIYRALYPREQAPAMPPANKSGKVK